MSSSISSAVGVPQYPDQHRAQGPVLFAVDQELGEGQIGGGINGGPGRFIFGVAMPIIESPMLTTRQFVLGLMVACLVGTAVGTVSLGLPLSATRVFGFVVLVVLLVSLVRFVRLLLVAPKARQLYPGVPLVTGALLFGLMTLLTTFGYFRMWMVAAIVIWMLLSCAMGLLATQGRERHQLVVNMAIGVPVILVLVVLVFLVSDGPLF